MKERIRSTTVWLAVFLMLFQLTIPAMAVQKESFSYLNDEVYEKLYAVYDNAEEFCVDRTALNNSHIGSPIYTYELVDNDIKELSIVFYPIISNNEILFFIINNNGSVTAFVDMDRSFTDGLSEFLGTKAQIALLYDSESCYVVTKTGAEKIASFGQKIKYRDTFTDTAQAVDLAAEKDIAFSEVFPAERINTTRLTTGNDLAVYSANSVAADVSLYVPFVSQLINGNGSYLCWAASIACIGNYLTDYSYTAIEIAQSVWGPNDYNYTLGIPYTGGVLQSNYGVYYRYYAESSAPSDSLLVTNLRAGYPVYACWSWQTANSAGRHATVIRGIQQSTDSVFLMDPEYGFYIGDRTSNGYSYTNTNGLVLTLDGYCSMLM